jgi:uncharacterized protein with FMN-binding domain
MPRAITALVVTVAATVLVVNFHPAAIHAVAVTRKSTSKGTVAQAKPAAQSRTVEGNAVDTQYGPVQVKLTVKGTTIESVRAIELPFDNPQSQQISTQAEPLLRSEALQAQSAQIDVVSGATYTSEGYASSLQSAMDKVRQS